ncbi:receptor protein-tyrosine kinase cepr1 [Quercus suber]|uniref:Receptor protein-tyrosine kinase cepr1 n=1 Tax=Quercus suber TaxID=58331 RepID=A0AAW0LZM8_QUESU
MNLLTSGFIVQGAGCKADGWSGFIRVRKGRVGLNFNENEGFNFWPLPENISRLKKLKRMILSASTLQGPIPATIGYMTSLVDLEFSGNYLVGQIPKEIGLLKNLQQHLELYRNLLSGDIPEEI